MTVAADLARWAIGLQLDDVPEPVRHAARRHLLDGVGCALAARRDGVVDFAVATAARVTAPAESTVLGGGPMLPAPAAALANGALVHGHDFDDTHAGGLVHATAAVLPAAFAVGEEVGATEAEVLVAAVAGYEAVCRIAAAVPHGFHARGLHATSVCGVFAAALIAARLYGLDAETTTNALGIAGSASAGSLEFLATGSATKQLHPGLAGQAGVTAARLAAAGATGPSSIFEGEHGLYRSYLGVDVDPDRITGELGQRWETTRITIKPYPACQLVHAPLDALATVLVDIGDRDSIVEVAFDVPADSVPIVCEPRPTKVAPRTAYEAKFSLPWSAAALVCDGVVGVSTYEAASISRPQVVALAERITARTVEVDGPAADAAGVVRVMLTDGRRLDGRVAHSAGGPDSPLTDDALIAKFASNGGTPEQAATILDLGASERPFTLKEFA